MPGIISGTLGVDSAITDTFRLPVGIYAHLRLCCPGVDFSTVPATGGPYYLFTTKASDGTDQLTAWSFVLLADGTNKNIILNLPLSPLPGVGLNVLTANAQFSTSAPAGYKTSAYHGGGDLLKDGTYANPTHHLKVVGAGTITITGTNTITGTGTAFDASMVGKTIYSASNSLGVFITSFTDVHHMGCATAANCAGEAYSIGGPLDVSGIAGTTGGSGTGPNGFDTGYSQAWYIDVAPTPTPGPTAPGALPLTGVGNSGMFRTSFEQPDTDRACFFNGYDLNRLFWARNGTPYFMGLPSPAAPSCAKSPGLNPGNTGAFNYRVRWVNSTRNVVSLPSDFTVTAQDAADVANVWRITQPTLPANWVITHWIIERTTQSGGVYYPINRSTANPYGTAITTTYFDDVVKDDDAFTQRLVYPSNQAQARPFVFGFTNQGRLFMGGAISMQLSGVAATNGTKNVTGLAGMTAQMVGWSISFGYSAQNTLKDGDVNRYTIAAVPSSTTCTLDRNIDKSTIVYGPGGLTPALLFAFIGDIQNRGTWSEIDCPEYNGTPNALGNSNEIFIGDAEKLTGGIGLGSISGTNLVLWTKHTQCFLHTYGPDPSFEVGGKVVQLPVKRGALNRRCLCYANGVVYGMDQYGLWAYSPGQIPVEIGSSVRGLWQSEGLDFAYSDWFWVQHRPEDRTIVFFVVEAGATRAKLGLVYDSDTGKFHVERHVMGRTCGYAAPDKDGLVRAHSYNAVAGFAYAQPMCHGIGKSDGVKWSDNTLPLATVTGIASGPPRITCAAAAWVADVLIGATVTIRRAGVKIGSGLIGINSGTVLTTNVDTGAMVGDIAEIGGIDWKVRSCRSDAEAPERKKNLKVATIKLREKVTAPVKSVNVALYTDGGTVANTDRGSYGPEDGVQSVAGQGWQTVTPAGKQRYPLSLSGADCTDFQLELSGSGAGAPVEVLAPVRVSLDVDEAKVPRR